VKMSDRDYIFGIIRYLRVRHLISFVITTLDFSCLYEWWEKRIPISIIEESIDSVVQKRRQRHKPIFAFTNFYYEVERNHKIYLQLQVGAEHSQGDQPDSVVRDIVVISQLIEKNADLVLAHHQDDAELSVCTQVFLRSLVPGLRTPEVERRYRLNFLISRYRKNRRTLEEVLSDE